MKLRIGAPPLLLLATAAILVVLHLLHQAEPTYDGRTLSSWVEEYGAGGPLVQTSRGLIRSPLNTRNEVSAAILAIGTKAPPHLLKWVFYETPNPRMLLLDWVPAPIANKLMEFHRRLNGRAEGSLQAFVLLGTNASTVIPKLAVIANDTTRIFKANRAALILSHLGPEALPPLLKAMSTRSAIGRAFIADEIAAHLIPTLNSTDSLPLLLNILRTQGEPLQSAASNAISRIAPEVLTNAPAQ